MGVPKATVCVVNYRTLDLIRLCLRSIRKFTAPPHNVLVVDNNSQDESLEYLRSLSWIQLIERKPEVPDRDGPDAHGAALDFGVTHCDTEVFISLHSDTVILQPGWLELLLQPFEDKRVASVGTGKLELKPQWELWLQKATDYKALQRKLFASPQKKLNYRYFNTTICSAYRTETLKNEGLHFRSTREPRLTVGREIYYSLQERDYRTIAIPPTKMSNYMAHLAHATQALHAQEFNMCPRGERKYLQRVRKVLDREVVQAILADNSLDQ